MSDSVQRIGCGFSCFNLLEESPAGTSSSNASRVTSVAQGALPAETQLADLSTEALNKILPKQLEGMFPTQTDGQQVSAKLRLEELSLSVLNQILPNLSNDLLQFISDKHLEDPDFAWSKLNEEQIYSILSKCFYLNDGAVINAEIGRRLDLLPIASLNQILPELLGDLLGFISDKHLVDQDFAWSKLSEDQLVGVFLMIEQFSENNLGAIALKSQRRLDLLPITSLNQILPQLPLEMLQFISNDHLQNRDFAWSSFSAQQLLSIFPITGSFSENKHGVIALESQRRLGLLPVASLNQILPKLSGMLLGFISDAHLEDPDFAWSELTENQVCSILSRRYYMNDDTKRRTEIRRRLDLLPVASLNQILPKLSWEMLQFISNDHLQNRDFAWSSLIAKHLQTIFPAPGWSSSYPRKQIRMSKKWRDFMSLSSLNQVLKNLEGLNLALISEDHLRSETLDLSELKPMQVLALCSESFLVEGLGRASDPIYSLKLSTGRVNILPEKVRKQIELMKDNEEFLKEIKKILAQKG